MFNKLTCNYRKCRRVLDHFAIACSCSHIFCEEHCPSNFGGTNVKCLACKVSLSQEKMDIIPVDLAPNERFKSMVLAGQRPEIIMDICSRALAFWMYQSQQEIDYNLYISKRLSDKCKAVEEDSRNLVAMLQREKTNLEIELQRTNKKCEELREKLIELSQRHQQLELEHGGGRSFTTPSGQLDSALGAPDKKRPSHMDLSLRNLSSNRADSQLKRSRSQLPPSASFQRPFFGAASRCFPSPDSTRASPAEQRPRGSVRSDPGSASIVGPPVRRLGHGAFPQQSAISSAFRCVPMAMKS